MQIGEDRGDLERMREIRIARGALLRAMRLHRIDIGAVEKGLVGVGIVPPDPIDELVLAHHARLAPHPALKWPLTKERSSDAAPVHFRRHQPLRLVPGDLLEDVGDVEPRLRVHIEGRSLDERRGLRGRLGRIDIFGDHRGGFGGLLVEDASALVIAPQKRVEIILRALLIGAHEFLEHRAPRRDRLGRREQPAELIFVDIRIARDRLCVAILDHRAGEMGRDDDGIDLTGLERRRHGEKRLQRPDGDALQIDGLRRRDLADLIMEGGADLGDADRMPGELAHIAKAFVPGRVRHEHHIAFIALRLLRLGRDDLQRAFAGEIEEAAGEGRDAKIEVARRRRDRDRLSGVEEGEDDRRGLHP